MSGARVLKVVPTLMCGGTENQFMMLARGLDRSRFDVEFACLRRWGSFVDEITERGIPLSEYKVTTFRSVHALAEQARLARHIVRRDVQIVHAYNFYGNVFAVPPARVAARVVIASIRDCAPYLTSMQKRVQRYACRLADCVLVNADAVKRWLVGEGYDESKIVIIRNGVDLTRFNGPTDADAIRRDLGLPAGTPLVVVVSRLTRLKGLEQLIEAAAVLTARHKDARFLIVGETAPSQRPYLDELKKRAADQGVADRVLFMGLRSDVPALLAAADVSVMPSLSEALSNVLLESMAAGAPTVATRVGGTPEALTDGKTGLLVPPGEVQPLAAAISRLLDDRALAAELGGAARQFVRAHLSVQRMVSATEQLYSELLARKQCKQPRALRSIYLQRPRLVDSVCLARSARWAPLCEPQQVPNSRSEPHSGAIRPARGLRMIPALSISSVPMRTAPPRSSGACRVELVNDHNEFLALERAWNDTVSRADVMHPFLRHEWVRTWWDAFGGGRELHVLIVRVDDEIAAIAPLMRESVVMYGVPVRCIRLIQNDHTPRTGLIVASHREESYRAVWNSLRDRRSEWDVVQLNQLESGSATSAAFLSHAAADGCPTGVWKSSDSPYLTLLDTWDQYLNGLSAKFRSNLRNRLSRATKTGEVTLEVLTERDAIRAASSDAWRLEASGWKQSAGTAIVCEPAVHDFYSRLIDRGTDAGWLQLLFLKLGGQRVAVSYGACFQRRLFLFKTGYDPEYATCAPFKLLTSFAIRDAYDRGLTELDFLGDAEPWKLEWTSTVRGHEWLFVFGTSARARLLHSVKFQLGPGLKRWWA